MRLIYDRTLKVPFLVFIFLITALSIATTIDLGLAFHVQQPLFLTGAIELLNSLKLPGGFAAYLAEFFTTLYALPVPGTLVLSGFLLVIPLLVYFRCNSKNNSLLSIVMASLTGILSLLLVMHYRFKLDNLLALAGGLLLAVFATLALRKIKVITSQLIIVAILLLVAFQLFGGIGLLTSAIAIIINQLTSPGTKSQKFTISALSAGISLVLPLIAVKVKFELIPLPTAYFGNFINDEHYTNPKMLYVFSVALLLIWVLSGFRFDKIKSSKSWAYWIAYAVVALIVILLPKILLDKTEKNEILVDYYASLGKWDKVLEIADNNLQENYIVAFQVNRALQSSGGLLTNAFKAKQQFGANALFVEANINRLILMPTSDIYYDLGFINESRHWAHEAYTRLGKQPRILKRLVQVNIISQKYNTAYKYILILKKSLLYKDWALEQEKFLYNESAIAQNIEYNKKRALIPVYDFFSNKNNPESNLVNLINQPALNHMAFDYMMTDLLMKHDLIHLIKNVYLFKEFGYKTLPKLVQEGVVLYLFKTQLPSVDLAGFKLDAANIERFKTYSKLYTLYKNNDSRAKETLDREYSDSYWYYIHFKSPLTKTKSN